MLPPADLQVIERREGTVIVVELHGELDVFSAPDCQQHLADVIAPGNELIVLDLRHLSFINSTGLTVLVRAQQDLAAKDGRLVLAAVPPMTMRILEITGLASVFDIRSDNPAAISATTEAPGGSRENGGFRPRA